MKISKSAIRVASTFGRLPALAASVMISFAAFAPAANAVVVVSPASNVAVPLTTAGVYVNVVSGVSNTAPASAPGWDINPYGSAGLSFFNPTTPTGGVYVVSVAGQVANLAAGTVIGASTPLFGSGAATTTAASSPWALNATNYFGFRFIGDDTLLHYGYGSVIVGSTLSTRTIGNLYYESVAGASITVSPVPEASTNAMMLAGGALLAATVIRRRRQG